MVRLIIEDSIRSVNPLLIYNYDSLVGCLLNVDREAHSRQGFDAVERRLFPEIQKCDVFGVRNVELGLDVHCRGVLPTGDNRQCCSHFDLSRAERLHIFVVFLSSYCEGS